MTNQENFKLPEELQRQFHEVTREQKVNRSALLRSMVEDWLSNTTNQTVGG